METITKIDTSISLTTSIQTGIMEFKSAVCKIRDILRHPSVAITALDSMRHICLYLMSRYITRDTAPVLKVPIQFAWESIMETLYHEGGPAKALEAFYNKTEDCLVLHFDRLFGTEKFSFDVKNALKHKEILEILKDVNMKELDSSIDILGWVYEQHIGKGSGSARDLGQFFTDRSICNYMIELCSPKFKQEGVPESVCDPTMGTGGFLSSYVKYYKQKYEGVPINWKLQQAEIHGCDTDMKVAGIARMNLFMETNGHNCENLKTFDSLHNDLTPFTYDIILANMPFGLKGIKYTDCSKRIKSLGINGTKSEPLFLQLMMVSLNAGGRCAVVVPDGMLVNNSKCHNETRKYLLDHFELKRVIKMKGQFFMNTGIQPSILFFENTGKPTTTIEFWDTEKNADGSIKEDLVLSVARTVMDETYSFDMRHYQAVDIVENSAGFAMMKLEDIVNALPGENLSPEETEAHPGAYEVVSGGKIPTKTYHKYNRDGNQISISKFGSYAGFVRWNKHPFWSLGSFTLIPIKDVICSMKYLYYYLSIHNYILYKYQRKGPTTNFYWSDVKSVIIPLPPLPIQEKIAEDLDLIYHNADYALKSIESMKRQMAAVMRSVSARGFERKKLGDVCVKLPRKGSHSAKDHDETGKYSLFTSSLYNVYKLHTYDYSDLCCIINSTNASGKAVVNVGQNFSVSSDTFIFKASSDIMTQYIQVYLSNNIHLVEAEFQGSNHKHPTWDRLSMIEIPNPPLSVQTEILAILKEMEAELKTLEQMAAKAESRARFILDGYLSTSAEAPVEEETTASVAPVSAVLTHAPATPISNVLTHEPAYESMTRSQLLEECKKKNLKGVSSKNKEDLIKMLESS